MSPLPITTASVRRSPYITVLNIEIILLGLQLSKPVILSPTLSTFSLSLCLRLFVLGFGNLTYLPYVSLQQWIQVQTSLQGNDELLSSDILDHCCAHYVKRAEVLLMLSCRTMLLLHILNLSLLNREALSRQNFVRRLACMLSSTFIIQVLDDLADNLSLYIDDKLIPL